MRVGVVVGATLLGMALGGWMSGTIFDLTGSPAASAKNEARKTAPRDRWREQRFGDVAIAAELVRPRIIKDRTARAWLRNHGGRAEFAAPLDSCSQSSAKFVILLPETSHGLYAAFFKNNSIPHGAAPPTRHNTVTRSFEPSTRGRARCVTLNV
jgi:hypothetical protein